MKARTLLPVLSLMLFSPMAAWAQDPLKVDAAHYKLVFENPAVRVLKVSYPVGAKSVMHKHPDSIVVPLAASKVKFTTPDGKSQDSDMAAESAMYTPAGTHLPANVGGGAVDALLVEFKTAAPGTATLPASRPGMAMKVLTEGPRAIAYRTTADPAFKEPPGTKHDFDQIVISLNASQMSLAIDGKPAKTAWKRGDAVFIGRGVAHEASNTGGKPVDFIIVAIK